MDPLASQSDVEARLGRVLTGVEELRIEALLRDASANVRRVSTQMFTLGTTTGLVLGRRNGKVRLPQRPVVSVASVTDLNDNALTYTRAGDWLTVSLNLLNSWEIEPWTNPPTEIKVTYTHGGTVPDLIVGVVASVVARSLGVDPSETGTVQHQIDGFSETLGAAGAQGPVAMLASEREICESFKRPGAPISMLA